LPDGQLDVALSVSSSAKGLKNVASDHWPWSLDGASVNA
jgi:hypothetical protein